MPPSGSRPEPKPEIGSLLTPKTPTGLPGSLLEGDRVIGCGKPGTAAAEVEIGVGPRLRQSGRGRFTIGADAALDDAQARESLREQVARTVAERAGPEHELGLGELLLEDVERAGRVADVADIDALPRAAEQNARRASGLGGGAQERSEAGGGGRGGSGGKEVAAVHGEKYGRWTREGPCLAFLQ